jgi:hypothetical protein
VLLAIFGKRRPGQLNSLRPRRSARRSLSPLQNAIIGEDISVIGNSGFGNSGFGNSGIGNSGFGNSGIGNSGFGNSGFGTSGIGNSGIGNSGFGLPAINGLVVQVLIRSGRLMRMPEGRSTLLYRAARIDPDDLKREPLSPQRIAHRHRSPRFEQTLKVGQCGPEPNCTFYVQHYESLVEEQRCRARLREHGIRGFFLLSRT